MSLNTAPGRPSKGQVKCNSCKVSCLPKNGDWFFAPASDTQQVFLCRSCERTSAGEYKRTIPVR
jgi:hypothetical protein